MSGPENERTPGADQRAGGAEDRNHHHHPDSESIPRPDVRGDEKGLLPDTGAALDFLDHWCGDGLRVLTAIPLNGSKTTTATFGAGDSERMAEWIDARQGRQNIYFTVNRVFERVLREYDPAPSVIVDSGGGYQGFWLLDAPVVMEGERGDEARHLPVEDRNRRIEVALGGDNCHNIDRIMRLPGTVNLPGEKKRKKGRTPRVARVIFADWSLRYRLADFAPLANAANSGAGSEAVPVTASPARDVSLESLPEAVTDRTRMLIENGDDPDKPFPSRSEAVFAVVCDLCRANVPDDLILGILTDPKYPISAHVKENGELTYARRQIERAREVVKDAFECDKDGNPYRNSQHNIRLAIRKLGASVRLDEFSGRELVTGLDGFGPMLDEAAATEMWLKADARRHSLCQGGWRVDADCRCPARSTTRHKI